MTARESLTVSDGLKSKLQRKVFPMSRGRKSEYPFRPARKGKPKSSNSGGGKRKTWVSLVEKVENGRDVGKRLNFPWFKAPIYVLARLKKWGKT
jgi:hypothetical protein